MKRTSDGMNEKSPLGGCEEYEVREDERGGVMGAADVGYGTEPSPRGEGVSGADGCGERIGKHYTPHTRPYGAPSPKGEGKRGCGECRTNADVCHSERSEESQKERTE